MPYPIETIRHSTAHLLAAAVLELFPETKLGIGPVIENGFYYDFDLSSVASAKDGPPQPLTPNDLPRIEKRMRKIMERREPFVREEMSLDAAIKFFQDQKQDYKVELLKDLKERGTTVIKDDEKLELGGEKSNIASVYHTGKLVDLCRGPHAATTKDLGVFKLTKIAGAYWRGSEKNKMLTRVYGLAFATQKELDDHLTMMAEAEKRDHRKLGEQLDLFVISELVGPGLPLYTFKGTIILEGIKSYCNELQKTIGYQEVRTPSMNRAELFKISGHYEKYKDGMFKVSSNYTKEEYFLKPMNCPQHTQIFASKPRSYKDLPMRIADFSQLHRDEKTGELSGLTRLRGFRQDDGHSFCREDQIKDEFKSVLSIVKKTMKTYGMNYKIRLSLWDPKQPEKYLGEPKVWEKSQTLLEEILVENKIEYFKAVGEAAIYGPKMDLISRDSLGREWQLSTIQLDFIMPQRFGLKYTDSDGKEKTPVMVHRAIVGSPERFLGILIEHYAGAFPVWLSPVQVYVTPVGKAHYSPAKKLGKLLQAEGIRVEVDDAHETISYKVRKAEKQKIPYILVVGDKEAKLEYLNVRLRGQEKMKKMTVKKFVEMIKKEIATRK